MLNVICHLSLFMKMENIQRKNEGFLLYAVPASRRGGRVLRFAIGSCHWQAPSRSKPHLECAVCTLGSCDLFCLRSMCSPFCFTPFAICSAEHYRKPQAFFTLHIVMCWVWKWLIYCVPRGRSKNIYHILSLLSAHQIGTKGRT